MTPEDIERMHADAVKNGADPKTLEKQRREALAECGGDPEQMARWADFDDRLDRYWQSLRPSRRRH
ncbi:hypothetical protein [Streptosporangium sp. NPDC002524]|uniref:hypothetical protein n=1 Tax=Streptosporangium sp. NPDC002524 TaxID=3154537 RepID=UPI0033229F9E